MNSLVKSILLAVTIVLGVILLYYIRSVIAYVLISVIISLLGTPVMLFFEKKNWPNGLSAGITLILIVAIISGILSLFIPLVMEQAQVISNISQDNVHENMSGPITDLEDWVDSRNMVPEGQTKSQYVKEKINGLMGFMNVNVLFKSLLGEISSLFIGIMSVLFISFFLLKDNKMLYRIIYGLTPANNQGKMREVLADVKETITRYTAGVLVQITLITLIVYGGLSIVGVQHAFLIGFLAGLLNVIPYVGPMIGAFFGIIIGVSGHLDMDFYTEMIPFIGKIALVFGVVQILDGFVFQPYIFSNSVNAHPLEIFLVILIAGTLAGISGMIVAVPLYSIARIVLRAYYSRFTLVQTITKQMDKPRGPSLKDKIKKIKDDLKDNEEME